MKKIHVGFLLSYDYEKLRNSIPPVYEQADAIFIAADKDYRTWSGENFTVDESFFDWLREIDHDKKIQIYRDDFYVPELSAIENDNRERHMLSLKMGVGNWLVQVDSDEYFLDFKKFVRDLRKYDHFLDNPERNRVQIAAYLVNMYKYTENGLLYVNKVTRGLMATNYPDYKVARHTRQRVIYTPNILWHESLARTEEAILFKLRNWGHNVDVGIDAFMEKWRAVNEHNYKDMRDFFYMTPKKWKELSFVKGRNLEEVSQNFDAKKMLPTPLFIWRKNFYQWFKFLFRKPENR